MSTAWSQTTTYPFTVEQVRSADLRSPQHGSRACLFSIFSPSSTRRKRFESSSEARRSCSTTCGTAEKETYSSSSLPDFRKAESIAHVHGDQQRCAQLAYPDVEPLPSPSVAARSALLTRTVVMHCLSNLPSTHVHANTAETHKVAVTRVSPVCQGRNVSLTHRHFYVRPSMSHARRNAAAQAVMQQTAAPTIDQVNTKTLLCTSVTANTFDQALDEIHQISKAGADLIELRLDMLTDFNVEEHLQQLLNTTNTPKLVTMRPVWEG